MKSIVMIYSVVLIIIGVVGIALNRKNIIVILIIIELILFSICLILTITSSSNNDINPLVLTFYVLSLAGSELAIGLTIVLKYYLTKTN